MKALKLILKTLGIIVGLILLAVILVFGYLTIVEYKPKNVEPLEIAAGTRKVNLGDSLSIMSFNIGYAGYDKDEDFFMDGGKTVRQDSSKAIEANLSGIASIIGEKNPDACFIQEIDFDSHRSFYINELAYLESALGKKMTFAYNLNVDFIPYPIPPIGKVNSGIATMTDLEVREASRYQLPCPFKWPVRIGNLKRCMLEERIPVGDTGKELVLLNFHLEAYDDGEGKVAQTAFLYDKIAEEYAAGNYVIAGGDFNQTFDGVTNPEILYPEDWMPGYLLSEDLPEGFSFAVADNVPTCRSLAREYVDLETSQTYIIDGFVVSDNVQVNSIEVCDYQFEYSDHNPVLLNVVIR